MSTKAVKVYSTPTCPWCKRAKKFLEDNGIAYDDLDVGGAKEAREEMVRKSGQMAVPVIEIDNEVGVGFDEGWLREKLGL
jgi:glutaredoxin-like YruB-family protein